MPYTGEKAIPEERENKLSIDEKVSKLLNN